jgi:protein tyrosine/serine phosphatase
MLKLHNMARWVLLGCAVLACAGAAAWRVWLQDWPAHRFLVVQEGVLYRGGQPDKAGLKDILDQYHVRTVVNLRGAEPGESWWRTERAVCRKRGVEMDDVEVVPGESAASSIRAFLAIATDPNRQPVYVHCEAGTTRTGFAVAAYRIAAGGWSYQAAREEALRNRFTPEIDHHCVYDRLMRQLAGGADWRHWPDAESAGVPAATDAAARP